jgi:hypothetical protein
VGGVGGELEWDRGEGHKINGSPTSLTPYLDTTRKFLCDLHTNGGIKT